MKDKEIAASPLSPPLLHVTASTRASTTDMEKSSQDSRVASTLGFLHSRVASTLGFLDESNTSPRVQQTIIFPYDYSKVIGNNKSKFLQEATSVLSLNGARDVECYDVRPCSIILELRGSISDVASVVKDLLTYALKLPSFPKIKAMDPDATYPTRGPIDTNPQQRYRAFASGTTATTQSPQTDVTDTHLGS